MTFFSMGNEFSCLEEDLDWEKIKQVFLLSSLM